MIQSFSINTVKNGYTICVHSQQDGEMVLDDFVFESPAKLRKAVKIFLDQLTQKGE